MCGECNWPMEKKRDLTEIPELGKGPLTLGIFCTKCNAQFELGKEGAAMAVLSDCSFLEYLKWVQSSRCDSCGVCLNE